MACLTSVASMATGHLPQLLPSCCPLLILNPTEIITHVLQLLDTTPAALLLDNTRNVAVGEVAA